MEQPIQQRIVSILWIMTVPLSKEHWSVTTNAWYHRPNESSPQPGVLPYDNPNANTGLPGLDVSDKDTPGTWVELNDALLEPL